VAAPLKAVIFDVDGTLIDSVLQHAQAWQDALREFGIEADLNEVRRQIGKGGDQLLPVFLRPDQIRAFGDELSKRRGVILKERYLPTITGFPQVRELFERILQQGYKIALGSSAKADELDHYKKLAGIQDLPMEATASDEGAKSKPHPDIFEAALQKLGCQGHEAIAIGDTPYDAEAAAKAGMQTIGLLTGGWSAAELTEANCMAIFIDPADLLRKWDRSPLAMQG